MRNLLFLLLFSTPVLAQQSYSLADLQRKGATQAYNRTAAAFTENDRTGLQLNEQPNAGAIWLSGETFGEGIIELDIQGNDRLQRSFVGVAFHVQDSTHYEAIYFRPFNFRATDPVRKIHAVQYIALPQYDWDVLRTNRPGEFEKAANPAPDPNAWFHARIEVGEKEVRVFVDRATSPSLTVPRLLHEKSGGIGLWAGNQSGGKFANLTIERKK